MKLKTIALLLLIALMNCATYEYSLNNYDVPVSFSNEKNNESEKSREFVIEKKLTWVLFDLINVQKLDVSNILKENFPNAKKIYNLSIHSEEAGDDSVLRLFGTGMQLWAFVTNRSLISRRTVIIKGEVIEEDPVPMER